MISTSKSNKYVEFQRNIALTEKRFVPFIGSNYEKGISGLKILIIGPRHYCDASLNSRNILAYVREDQKRNWKTGETVSFKIGCMKKDAHDCLLPGNHNNCPVYDNVDTRICPVGGGKASGQCKIRAFEYEDGGFECNGIRNLRCETIIGISDFLNPPTKQIESSREGMTYFQTITNFIKLNFKPKSSDVNYIWSHVSYINLIQKFISKIGFPDNNSIKTKVDEYDRQQVLITIEVLMPDVIITTMDCVRYHLTTIANKLGYIHETSFGDLDYHIFRKKDIKDDIIVKKWKILIRNFFENYTFPKSEYHLCGDIKGLINILTKSEYYTLLKNTKSGEKELRCYIKKILSEKAKFVDVKYLQKPKFCDGNYDEDTLRKWISNNNSSPLNGESIMRRVISEFKCKL